MYMPHAYVFTFACFVCVCVCILLFAVQRVFVEVKPQAVMAHDALKHNECLLCLK